MIQFLSGEHQTRSAYQKFLDSDLVKSFEYPLRAQKQAKSDQIDY